MPEFFLTFGQEHPDNAVHLRFHKAHHDGWIRIVAADLDEATRFAQSHLGVDYNAIYPAEEFTPDLYPEKELGEIHGIAHLPVEYDWGRQDGSVARWIICSCSDPYLTPTQWSTPGHGEPYTTGPKGRSE